MLIGIMLVGLVGPGAMARGRWGEVVYVNTPPGYALNVRWGPGTSNGVYRKAFRGCTLKLSGKSRNGWLELTDGTWVAGNLVNRRQPTVCPTTQLPDTWDQRFYVVTPQGYALNIRQGPGTEYRRLGQYTNGTEIWVTGRTINNWAQLPNGSWVDRTHLSTRRPYPYSTLTPPPTSDPNVVELQLLLRQLGYLPSTFVPNGIYDEITQEAVKRFQRANGLAPTGVVDTATWQALYAAANRPTPTPTVTVTTTPTPTVTVTTTPTPTVTVTETPTPTPTATGQQMRVVTDGEDVLVFDGPGPQYDELRYLANGTVVNTTGKIEGNWTELADGGWVFSLWLEPVN
jgi:uncharacterized protein YraI